MQAALCFRGGRNLRVRGASAYHRHRRRVLIGVCHVSEVKCHMERVLCLVTPHQVMNNPKSSFYQSQMDCRLVTWWWETCFPLTNPLPSRATEGSWCYVWRYPRLVTTL